MYKRKVMSRRAKNRFVKGKLSIRSNNANIGSYSVDIGLPDVRDPLLNPENLYLPHNIKILNKWIRHYVSTHPILGNCIELHAVFPVSDFRIQGIDDPSIKKFYEYVKEDVLHLYDWLLFSSYEYEQFGEVYTYFSWDTMNGYFDSFTILNPDLLDVFPFDDKGGRKYIVDMEVPAIFKEIHLRKDRDSRFMQIWDQVHPIIKMAIEQGRKIPFSPNNIYAMQRLTSPYNSRGTSQVLRVLKDLIYEDKLREADMAVADSHITPIELWKLGDDTWIPNEEDIEAFHQLLNEGDHQNYYRIVTHSKVNYESISRSSGLLDTTTKMDKIAERILIGLYTSKPMITGDAPTYSGSVVAYKILEKRYVNKRVRQEKIIRDLYRKIAAAHGFAKITEAELSHRIRVPNNNFIIPQIGWKDDFSFSKDQSRIEFLSQLADKNKISWKTVIEMLGFDYDEEMEKIKKEMETVMDSDVYNAKVQKLIDLLQQNEGNPSEGEEVTNVPIPNGNSTELPEAPSVNPEEELRTAPLPGGILEV